MLRHRPGRRRVRALLGEVPPDFKERLKEALSKELTLERGTLAPMDPPAQSRAVAVFADPV